MKALDPNYTSAKDEDAPASVVSIPTVRFRSRLFLQSLSQARRAEIACRPRFHSILFIRPANPPDPDDFLP